MSVDTAVVSEDTIFVLRLCTSTSRQAHLCNSSLSKLPTHLGQRLNVMFFRVSLRRSADTAGHGCPSCNPERSEAGTPTCAGGYKLRAGSARTQELAGNVLRTAGFRFFFSWTSTATCPSFGGAPAPHVVVEGRSFLYFMLEVGRTPAIDVLGAGLRCCFFVASSPSLATHMLGWFLGFVKVDS